MAMPVRRNRSGHIDQVHHSPAQNIPEHVRVLRKDQFRHFRSRCADRPPFQLRFRYGFYFLDGSFHPLLKPPRKFGVRSGSEYTMRMTSTQPQKKTRRQILEDFVAAKPADAFARYGLAMECANSGDAPAAGEHFQALLASHPEYVAGYFQYGQFLAKSGRTDEARSTLTAGIVAARRAGDEHARSEMEAALAELG